MSFASGLVLIDKPAGITSHDAVAKMRKSLSTRRVGHAGTLDPMATGLLVLGVNSGSKLLHYISGVDKTYLATVRLGWSTHSDDETGETVGPVADSKKLHQIDDGQITDVIASFLGEQLQVPSSVSAIKVEGRRSYDRVRSGEEVLLAARPVTISQIELVGELRRSASNGVIEFDLMVSCSSGTYIRAIARDMGKRLSVGGHLASLRRTRVGPFSVDDASPLDQPVLIPLLESASALMPALAVSADQVADLRFGRALRLDANKQPLAEGNMAAVLDEKQFVAVVEVSSGLAQPKWVVAGW